jgi:hypothetical protein
LWHPIPQFVFSQKKGEEGETANNMSNFVLLYPSQALADAFDPVGAFIHRRSIDDLRSEAAGRIDRLICDAQLHRFASAQGESDRWYWAAPLLLDRSTPSHHTNVEGWLEAKSLRAKSNFFNDEKRGGSSKSKHFDEFARCFSDPSASGLGPLPKDLAQVLADMAIASPAVTTLRSASAQFSTDFNRRALFAFDLANEFLSLFNKPESIAAVRLSTDPAPYWRRVLRYCTAGCLQSVLDEFFSSAEIRLPNDFRTL